MRRSRSLSGCVSHKANVGEGEEREQQTSGERPIDKEGRGATLRTYPLARTHTCYRAFTSPAPHPRPDSTPASCLRASTRPCWTGGEARWAACRGHISGCGELVRGHGKRDVATWAAWRTRGEASLQRCSRDGAGMVRGGQTRPASADWPLSASTKSRYRSVRDRAFGIIDTASISSTSTAPVPSLPVVEGPVQQTQTQAHTQTRRRQQHQTTPA
ncbi:hypothetical protein P171DRAFT_59775 [Karstenula rhodostoma CBS 690.94]|uniref:Uncharacterized protein n=1 Tax=Karstenula rhodostoma CBS 690.94 TaxID=1392251 RepID=A0A9P4PBL6_9PLEO|nr:hypothetical protein P171DRAFT_59775 [Karstenula rhodostoma CBS 690.94]